MPYPTCFFVRRITPAGAGKTSMIRFALAIVEDHPRRCGENRSALSGHWHGGGSPPQVRGKPRFVFRTARGQRITPAGAGKTRKAKTVRAAEKDHPRRCGENPIASTKIGSSKGSPPQVRGKLPSGCGSAVLVRITPAGAGKTCYTSVIYSIVKGSPPQVRGKLVYPSRIPSPRRITPAGAGKTFLRLLIFTASPDHPRRCGENSHIFSYSSQAPGSPPQVRGKLSPFGIKVEFDRITPAGAGKTFLAELAEML